MYIRYQGTYGALLKDVWIIKPSTALLEFQLDPTQIALMKATSEPETNLVGYGS